MSDSAASAGNIDEADPLAMEAGSVDLARPIAPASNYILVIKDAKVEPNKKNTGNNLVTKWANTSDITSTKGDIIPAGSMVITQYTGLTPTEKRSNKDIAQDCARLIRGSRLPDATTGRDLINNPTILIGKELMVKVAIKKETDEFPEANEIKGIVLEG